jgi:hypothetical protein
MRDTARDAEKKQIEILRRMGPEGRLHAAYNERQIRLETIRLTLPEELFRAAYSEVGEHKP